MEETKTPVVETPHQPVEPTTPVTPPTAPTEPATAATTATSTPKKKSNTVLIILIILGILAVICCGIGGVLMLFAARVKNEIKNNPDFNIPTITIEEPTEETTPEPTVSSSLKMITTEDYTFYYPKAFTSSPVTGKTYTYSSPIQNTNKTYDTIDFVSTTKPADENEMPECSAYATQLSKTAFSEYTANGATVTALGGTEVDRNEMSGCDLKFMVSKSTFAYYIDALMVFKPNDTKLYVLRIGYDSKTSANHQQLENAKNAFVIK